MEELQSNPFAKWEDKADDLVPSATLQIYNEIEISLKGEENGNVLRASAASLCVRRRWYQRNGYVGSPLTPRKIVNFLLGDLSERTLVHFIKKGCVGHGKIYSEVKFGDPLGKIQFQGRDIEIYKQHTMSFELQGNTITGHADGFGKRNIDGQWELIEIKSAADYGFQSFQKDGPGDYLKQAHALMLTKECRELDIKTVRFFYLRKSTGHLWDRAFHYDELIAEDVRRSFLLSAGDMIPVAPYDYVEAKIRGKPTGRTTVPWQCQYCGFLKECKGEYELEWKSDQFGNMKPSYWFKRKEQVCNSVEVQNPRAVGTF